METADSTPQTSPVRRRRTSRPPKREVSVASGSPRVSAAPESGDYCEYISRHATNVVGLASNSSSESDAWLVSFAEPRLSLVMEAFMKIFYFERGVQHSTSSLSQTYEALIYRDIVRPIIERKMSPHFVFNYGIGSCDIRTLSRILSRSSALVAAHPRDEAARMREAVNLIARNASIVIGSSRYNERVRSIREDNSLTETERARELRRLRETAPKLRKRFAVTDTRQSLADVRRAGVPIVDMRDVTFGFILNESTRGAKTLNEWASRSARTLTELLLALFQTATACHAMCVMRLAHNDTHLDNVYIRELDTPSVFAYEIAGDNGIGETDHYEMIATFRTQIYDFDLSYAETLGPNPNIYADPERFCERNRDCNALYPARDILKVAAGYFQVALLPRYGRQFEDPKTGIRAFRRALQQRPLTANVAFLFDFVKCFARFSHENAESAAVHSRAEALLDPFITDDFLHGINVSPEEIASHKYPIGVNDLPGPRDALRNLSALILRREQRAASATSRVFSASIAGRVGAPLSLQTVPIQSLPRIESFSVI